MSRAQVVEGRDGRIVWGNGLIELHLDVDPDRPVGVVGLAGRGFGLRTGPARRLVEVLAPEVGRRPGSPRISDTEIGAALRFVGAQAVREPGLDTLRVTQRDSLTGLLVVTVLELRDGVSAARTWTELTVEPTAGRGVLVEAVTSLSLGLAPTYLGAVDDLDVLWARTGWATENRWERTRLREAGAPDQNVAVNPHPPRTRCALRSTSSWSSGEWLPMGILTAHDDSASIAWQVEHPGAWGWEVGEDVDGLHVAATGPVEADHQWSEVLAPGDTFVSVPVSVVVVGGDWQESVAELTLQRRALRGPGGPLPVIYNDYMNTLFGDPDEEKEKPLIDGAAALGADVFCVDAGWYADDGEWWDGVGEWRESTQRFPSGLNATMERIRAAGMTPGLWLEPEVVGVRSPMAERLPASAFFSRRGVRVQESGRLHLDLRDDAARKHLDDTVARLVDSYGVGFFKLDYNTTPGTGTDSRDVAAGAGLLGHNRAWMDWLDGIAERHPGLLLENCASGAMRADDAALVRTHLQSTSDQCDPLLYAAIAAAAPMSILPEQAGNWAYAQQEMTDERAAFTLAAGVLGRLYLSGFVGRMDEARLGLVREAVALHRQLLGVMTTTVPFWPLGLVGWADDWIATGLRPAPGERGPTWVTVWRRGGGASAQLALPHLRGGSPAVQQVFPRAAAGWGAGWSGDGVLQVTTSVEEATSRIFRIG